MYVYKDINFIVLCFLHTSSDKYCVVALERELYKRYIAIASTTFTIDSTLNGGYNICHLAWENRGYVHIKFDRIF